MEPNEQTKPIIGSSKETNNEPALTKMEISIDPTLREAYLKLEQESNMSFDEIIESALRYSLEHMNFNE